MDATEQIKTLIPLEDVIAETVVLKPAGRDRLKGLCPFHSEKTPSFHVVVDKGYYWCFGCQAKGDLYTFVQKTQGLEFREALELLAARAGVTLPERSPQEAKKRDLYELNDLAQGYFTAQLTEHPHAAQYLEARGLTPETVETWGLGYAPDGWTNLTQHARTKGVELESLEAAGLARNKEGRFYDLFRNRITIPIKDLYGRVVGFSARTLGDDQPKYVNTPETAVFHKGNLLFGLDRAKTTIKDESAAILVEGQMDVIALHQAGFTAAVGAQSATLTEAQINALARLGLTRLYMAFDADDAGQRATLAGCDAVARQFIVKVAKLPHKDPAETVEENPELFRTALKNALSEPSFKIGRVCEGLDLNQSQVQIKMLKRLKDAMLGTGPDDYVAAEIREEVSRKLEISPSRLNAWLGDAHSAPPPSQKVVSATRDDLIKAFRVNIAALVLSREAQLEASCTRLRQVLPTGDPLAEFADRCAEVNYDVAKIWARLSEWPHVAGALKHLVKGVSLPLTRFESDLERYVKLVGLHQDKVSFPLSTAHDLSQPVSVSPVTPDTPENPSSPNIPGYEELKAYALERKDDSISVKLLETFALADLGDASALADLESYLQKPQVQQLIGIEVQAAA